MRMTTHDQTQLVRVIDVFALGPLMIWAASRSRDLPPSARLVLGLSGLATIAFNGWNYVAASKSRETLSDSDV